MDVVESRPLVEGSPVQPGIMSFVVALTVALGVSIWAWQQYGGAAGIMSWTTTVLWTLPFTASLLGIAGGSWTIRRERGAGGRPPVEPVRHDALVVVVPTIGRRDTYPALVRVVGSFEEHLPELFPHLSIDIVIEEACEAGDAIHELAGPRVRILTVPRGYRTPAGTRFKARANEYANEVRIARGDARDDVWVLHMDDDTGVGADTAREMARFINAQRERGADALHLAQGVLTFPREHGVRRVLWLADAVRPACDVSTFAITTGSGTPRGGLHGELLLVRGSIEATIGWDFGPRAMVEDAQFALRFTQLHPGRSGWFPGRSLGSTPASVNDFVRQRERWAWGLLELAANRDIPLRHRLLLIHNVVIWASGPLQHVGLIVIAGWLLGDLHTMPVTAALLPLWAINISFQVWCYWEGLKLNVRASADQRCRWWERVCIVALLPVFSLLEAAGVTRGFVRFVRHGETAFTVIAKPL